MLQPIICNFGLCHKIHLGLEHLINRREGRISNLSSHRFQRIPEMLSAWTSEVSPKLFGSFAAIWSQKIASCLCTAFREILAESSYTQTFLEQLLRYDCLHFCKDWFHQELWLEG